MATFDVNDTGADIRTRINAAITSVDAITAVSTAGGSDITNTVPLLGPDGSATAPSVSFSSDPDTGIYSSAANQLAIATNGAQVARVNNNGAWTLTATGTDTQLLGGTVDLGVENRTWALKSPATDSAGDPFVFETGNSWQFNVDTVAALTIDSTGQVLSRAGTTSNCGYAFEGDPNTGLFSAAADVAGLVAGGVRGIDVNPGSGFVVVNENAADIDFRVEGTTDVNLIRSDAGSDRVGFKTGAPVTDVDINGQLGVAAGTAAAPSYSFRTDLDTGMFSTGANDLSFSTGGVKRMEIGAGGDLNLPAVSTETKQLNIGVGRSGDGASLIDLIADGATYTDYGLRIVRNAGANGGTQIDHRGTGNFTLSTKEAANIAFQTDSTTRLSIGSGGAATFTGNILSGARVINSDGSATNPSYSFTNDVDTGMYRYGANAIGFATGGAEEVRITTTGMVITGSLSKGSGSFRIPHPIREGHDLVHSFVEGPTADNIYRGTVQLEDGKAVINLDEVSRMTEGTFVSLNTNVQCFTTNETDWTPVRGFVSGNLLTIGAKDPTEATVSWLVIGERHDDNIKGADWTDDNGRVITEPLSEVSDD